MRTTFVSTLSLLNSTRTNAAKLQTPITAGACIVGTGFTANAERVDSWVPITLGATGAVLVVGLLIDILMPRR